MKSEIIVEVGAEGGSLTLHGQHDGYGWLYSLNMFDQTLLWDDVEYDPEVVNKWPAAIKLLDEYPWHHLPPITVHPDFRARVLKAVLLRNRREGNDFGLQRWQDVCSEPALGDLAIAMNFKEIRIPKFGSSQGQLIAANPSFSKPSNITKLDWVSLVLQGVMNHDSGGRTFVLALPRSFWPIGTEELQDYAKSEGFEYIDLMDAWEGPRDYCFASPMESMQQIIYRLQRGIDVIILSQTKMISDFVRAFLHVISMRHSEHPAKGWCGIAPDGRVELNQFQRGYIYCLMDATGPFGLEQLRRDFHEGRVS